MDTRTVPFTQFIRPHGARRPVVISMPKSVAEKADKIIAAGYKMTCEILSNGLVSLAIEGKNCDVAIQVVPNGDQVPVAVEVMIDMFDFDDAKRRDDGAGL